jgi:hypothetical protein
MNDAEELKHLQNAWRQESRAVPDDLYRTVVRETRLMRFQAAVSALLGLAFLGGSLWKAVADPSVEFIALTVGVWIVTISALIYSFRIRAGTWAATEQNTNEFVSLSIRRCRAALQATTFGLWLLLVQVLFIGSWHAWYWSRHTPVPSAGTWVLAAALPIAFLISLLTVRAYRRRELRRLEHLHRELIG